MSSIFSVKGHFDGVAVVLDEPASLSVGQAVRIVVDPALPADTTPAARPSRFGFAKGTFEMGDDFNQPLDEFAEYR